MSWQIHKVKGGGPLPFLADRYAGKTLVILGGGAGVWNDVDALFRLLGYPPFTNERSYAPPCDIMAVNHVGLFWRPRLHHWLSIHEDILVHLAACRDAHHRDHGTTWLHTVSRYKENRLRGLPAASVAWEFSDAKAGTSSLAAVAAGIAMGYRRIVLCGVPMDGSGHFYGAGAAWDRAETRNTFRSSQQAALWIGCSRSWFGGKVRSMSGRTAAWLGVPVAGWLKTQRAQGA